MKIKIYVQPGAKKSGCAGYYGELLKIKLNAPPVDGAANAALTEFVAHALGLPKSAVEMTAGHTSRIKTLDINAQLSFDTIIERLATNNC